MVLACSVFLAGAQVPGERAPGQTLGGADRSDAAGGFDAEGAGWTIESEEDVQHHGHLRPGTALRDRAAPRARRTKGHIRVQFLSEAILLALAGGAADVIIGAAATAIYAHAKGWAIVIPAQAWAGGLAAALLIGALAGLLPTLRAARLSPIQALWTL